MIERAPFWFVVTLTLGACFAFDLTLEHLRLEYLADDIDGYTLAERLGIPFPVAPWSEAPAVSYATAAESGRNASNPLIDFPSPTSPSMHQPNMPASHYAYSFKKRHSTESTSGSPPKTEGANAGLQSPSKQYAGHQAKHAPSHDAVELRNVLSNHSKGYSAALDDDDDIYG
jgi:hypothetical protein